MSLREFKEFLKIGIIKKQLPNKQRALSLIKESEEKKKFLEISLKTIPPEEMRANFIVNQCYDIIMELLRAKMLIDGYNAGNSHEAEVSYLKVLGFQEPESRFLDDMRYYRNGTKYYGTILNMQYAKEDDILFGLKPEVSNKRITDF